MIHCRTTIGSPDCRNGADALSARPGGLRSPRHPRVKERNPNTTAAPPPGAATISPWERIARRLRAYEIRPQQLEMAQAVGDAFESGKHLFVEAGTGVGKSFAYLVPAIERVTQHGGRVVISTHTIALQEQLIEKDIPFLQKALPQSFRAVLVKGRSNYLGLRRLARASERKQTLFETMNELAELHRIEDWAYKTEDGSRSDLPFEPDLRVWDLARSDSDDCLGRKCEHYDKCFYQRARRKAVEAQLLIVNHAMLFSDLAVREQGASILPDYEYLILDEAHTVERVAAEHLGGSVSNAQVRHLLNLLHHERAARGVLDSRHLPEAIRVVENARRSLDRYFVELLDWSDEEGMTNGRVRKPVPLEQPLRGQHDGRALDAPDLAALPIGVNRIAVGQDHGRKLGVGSFDQRLLARRGQARDVVQFGPVDEQLVAAGDIAFVEDDGQARHVLVQLDQSLADGREQLGKAGGVGHGAAVGLMKKRQAGAAGTQERDADLAQVIALLLVVAAGRQRAVPVRGGDKGEKVGGVEEQRVQGHPEFVEEPLGQGAFDLCDALHGKLIHLIPEMLARQPRRIDPGQFAERGGAGPAREPALARRVAGAPDAGERERLPNRQAVVSYWRLPGLRRRVIGAGKPTAGRVQLAVDEAREIELLGLVPEGGDRPMREGAQPQRIRRLETSQQVIGLAEVGDGNRPGLPVDAARLHDVPVSVAADPTGLQACHGVVVYAKEIGRVKNLFSLLRMPISYEGPFIYHSHGAD